MAQQQQTPVQRDVVRQLLPQAEECWWSPGHVGWTLFDLDAMAPTAMQVRVCHSGPDSDPHSRALSIASFQWTIWSLCLSIPAHLVVHAACRCRQVVSLR